MSDWIEGWGQTWSSDYNLNIEINGFRYQWPSVTLNKQLDNPAGRRFLGEAKLLLRQVKNQMKFNQLGQYQMVRRFNDGSEIIARSVFGQDFISIKIGGGKIREEERQTFISMPCVAQWDFYQQKIFFTTEFPKFNFYMDLSIFGESIEGVKCITPLADHNLAVGGFVYKAPGSDTMKVVRYVVKEAGGPVITYNGQTYQKRTFTYRVTPISWTPVDVPIRTYPYRSTNASYSVSNYRAIRDHGLSGAAGMTNREATPCFMALWMETPTPQDPLGGIKFQLICYVPVEHMVTVSDGVNPSFDVHLSHHWQWVYHDGTSWNLVPDKNEEDNFELVLTGPYSGSHPYQYPGCFDRPPLILRDKDWIWDSETRHEVYNTNWTCYPVYRNDLRGLAGYLKIYHTHLADHSDSVGVQVKDLSRSVLALVGDPNHVDEEGNPAPILPSYQKATTYERTYTRELSFEAEDPHTMFQLIWKRGSHYVWNLSLYAPFYPVDLNPLGGGCGFYPVLPGIAPESRVNGYDANVGIVLDELLGGGGWRIVF